MKRKKGRWLGSRFFSRRETYEPWYDENSDYNTNAKSYYDYLARFNKLLRKMVEFINRLLDRDIEVEDTNSIDLTKTGDWIDNGECEPNHFNDVITLKADIIVSNATETRTYQNLNPRTFTIVNGSVIKNSGLWSPDYANVLSAIDDEIGNIYDDLEFIYEQLQEINYKIDQINNRIDEVEQENQRLRNALQKIVDNLYASGAITNNNINNFEFNSGRNIATGNINVFGGTPDGNSFIRTNSGQTNNDITAGV